ncbi:MAG: ATP phosphoribosyltransferase regulatory subunit [Clostridia bacterium]|nr:ATP phosphoribosyltransferase regulatory subunit [Clostridia bacterium]
MRNKVTTEESALYSFKRLYSSYGYTSFKMNRFEEYDLYANNKNFLISDNVITFTDTNGKLLALKPDVTLSIVKNTDPEKAPLQKLFYSENVYRVASKTHEYKEIMQVGLECIGKLDAYACAEVITLAAKSLELLDSDYVLDLSHMSFATQLLQEANIPHSKKAEIMTYIGEKNLHMITAACRENGVSEELTGMLVHLASIYETPDKAFSELEMLNINEETEKALMELRQLMAALRSSGIIEHIRFDFSVISDDRYYNGFTFAGYIHGVPRKVLSGGRYDNLMKKFKKDCGAIGFAIYFDALEQLLAEKDFNEVDTLILYDGDSDISVLCAQVNELAASGKKVTALRDIPKGLKYKNLLDLGGNRNG